MTLLPSLNRTKIRLVAGSKGMAVPLPFTKMANVAVAPAPIVVFTLLLGGATHAPVTGLVRHTVNTSGRGAPPGSAVTVMSPAAPTLTVATAKAPVLLLPGMFTVKGIPSSLGHVAPRATTSGTGVSDAESNRVFTPGKIGAGGVVGPAKLNSTSVGANGAVGVRPMT